MKTFKECCSEVAIKHGLGKSLVTGHKAGYWEEAAELYRNQPDESENNMLIECKKCHGYLFNGDSDIHKKYESKPCSCAIGDDEITDAVEFMTWAFKNCSWVEATTGENSEMIWTYMEDGKEKTINQLYDIFNQK